MRNYLEIKAIVEGKTEQIFIQKILGPYWLNEIEGLKGNIK